MTLALLAGAGDLPGAVLAARRARGQETLVCALDGSETRLAVNRRFRIEHFGSFLEDLRARGVDQICLAGPVKRPRIDPGAINDATLPLVGALQTALDLPDADALGLLIALFEAAGLQVVGAHEVAPDLLPRDGVLGRIAPRDLHRSQSALGDQVLRDMALTGIGQACLLRGDTVLAREGAAGTDAMILSMAPQPGAPLAAATAQGAILFKGPRPGQDRRVDLPVIGPTTIASARIAELAGIVITAGGVMVVQRDAVIAACDAAGLFLWVRAAP